MRRKWVKEELRKNEIVTITSRTIAFITKRQKLIKNLGIITLIVIILGTGGFFWWQSLETKAIDKLNQAHKLYNENKDKEAIDAYQPIVEKFSRTKSGAEALFYIANCYYNLSEYDKAIEIYQKFAKRYPKNILIPFAYESIGICKEEKKDFNGAIESYKELIEKYPQHFLLPKIYINLSRCLISENKNPEAQKEYQKILDFYPGSMWAQQAKEKIEQLKETSNKPEEKKSS